LIIDLGVLHFSELEIIDWQFIECHGKMLIVVHEKTIPDINKVSVISAAILLAYTIVGLIILPYEEPITPVPGFVFGISLDPGIFFALIISGLTATGTHWIVKDHPSFGDKYSIRFWMLPALTAWGFGLFIFQQPITTSWWIFTGVSALVLVLIMMAEYIIVDPNDIRRVPATIGLIALSNALLLILAITIRTIEARIFFLIPVIALASGLTCLKNLHLQFNQWAILQSIVIAILVGEISAGLYFLNLRPVTFGLLLLGPAYALTSLVGGIISNHSSRINYLEPIIVLMITWGLAILV
jgi:hypothetical protein